MITWIENGDIFESKCQTLVCPVNTVGVMGAGLALEFKRRWPHLYRAYKHSCVHGVEPGDLLLYSVGDKPMEKAVLCLPTKKHWGDPSMLGYIELGLQAFVNDGLKYVKSVAFPALGCGLGGLDWANVRPLMDRFLGKLDIPVEVYEPRGPA